LMSESQYHHNLLADQSNMISSKQVKSGCRM
jgi:hypothetical protein